MPIDDGTYQLSGCDGAGERSAAYLTIDGRGVRANFHRGGCVVHELLPVLMGGAIELACRRIRTRVLRVAAYCILVVLGTFASAWINGEPIGWPYFVVADVCFVLAGAVGVKVALRLLARARRRHSGLGSKAPDPTGR
jgi:hypothetical protein